MAAVKFFEHPDYTAREDAWETYRDLFEGDHATLSSIKYLWPHELEGSQQEATGQDPTTNQKWTLGQKLRYTRVLRSRYLNLFEPIVSTWVSMAFSKPIDIPKDVKDMFGEGELADVDGHGTSLENFIKNNIAIPYFLFGRPFLLVDAPGAPGGEEKFQNKLKEQEAGFRPFFEVLDVLAVKDWQLVQEGPLAGKFRWLRFEYRAIAPRTSPVDEPKEVLYSKVLLLDGSQYRQIVYRKSGEVWERDTELSVNGWKEVPVSTVMTNEPWVKDIAELQLQLFNYMSAWSNQLNTQAFQRVLIAADGIGPEQQAAISEYAWGRIPAGSGVHTIEPSDTSAHVDAMAWTVNQMYRVGFNRTRGLSDSSEEAPGADTLREMNAELADLLKVALTEIEGVVNAGLRYYARFKGKPDFQGKITFDKDLTPEDIQKQSETFLAYRDEIRKLLTWRKAHLRKVVRLEKFSEDETEDILEEIETLKLDPVPDPMAGFGPFVKGTDGGPKQPGQEGDEPPPADQAADDS